MSDDARGPADGETGDGERPWNRRPAAGSAGEGVDPGEDPRSADPFVGDEAVDRIGRRYRLVRLGAMAAVGVAAALAGFGIVAGLHGLGVVGSVGVVPSLLVAFALYAGARLLPTAIPEGRLVAEADGAPEAVRAAFADHRSPLFPLARALGDEAEYYENGWAVESGGWRTVRTEYATERNPDGTVDFELRQGGDPSVRGTIAVEPTPTGSRVTVEYERPRRIRPVELVVATVGNRFGVRLFEHLGYEVVEDDERYRLRA